MHAITLEHERLVNMHVACFKRLGWVRAKSSLRFRIIQPCFSPTNILVAKWPVGVLGPVALSAHIIQVQASFLCMSLSRISHHDWAGTYAEGGQTVDPNNTKLLVRKLRASHNHNTS